MTNTITSLIVALTASIICFVSPVSAQERAAFKHELRGVFRDEKAVVIPGLRLAVDGKSQSFTDINGEFSISLPVGDFVITSEQLTVNTFRAFIKITRAEMNPGFIDFVIDSNAISCFEMNGKALPRITASFMPSYPAPAYAVGAFGEVEVMERIRRDGTVLSATPLRGHPLLRTVSKLAAEKFKFESTDDPLEREVQLIFVFLLDQVEKPGVRRFQCPYRIIVPREPVTIDIIETKTRH